MGDRLAEIGRSTKAWARGESWGGGLWNRACLRFSRKSRRKKRSRIHHLGFTTFPPCWSIGLSLLPLLKLLPLLLLKLLLLKLLPRAFRHLAAAAAAAAAAHDDDDDGTGLG